MTLVSLLGFAGALSILWLIAKAHLPLQPAIMGYSAAGTLTLCYFIFSSMFVLLLFGRDSQAGTVFLLGLTLSPIGLAAAMVLASGGIHGGTLPQGYIRIVAILDAILLIVPAMIGMVWWPILLGGK